METQEDKKIILSQVIEGLESLTSMHQKIAEKYESMMIGLQKERRDMFRYLGTIAGGAAALAPQLINYVDLKSHYFYWGLSFLLICIIIAISNVISTLEKSAEELTTEFNKVFADIEEMRKLKIEFIETGDISPDAWKKHTEKDLQTIKKLKKDVDLRRIKKVSQGFYRPMDYTSEYLIFSFILGIGLIILSVTHTALGSKLLWLSILGIFIIINIISIFPTKIFTVLGFPMDIAKGTFRKIFQQQARNKSLGVENVDHNI